MFSQWCMSILLFGHNLFLFRRFFVECATTLLDTLLYKFSTFLSWLSLFFSSVFIFSLICSLMYFCVVSFLSMLFSILPIRSQLSLSFSVLSLVSPLWKRNTHIYTQVFLLWHINPWFPFGSHFPPDLGYFFPAVYPFFSLGLGSSGASSHFSFSQLNAHNLSVCLMHLYLFVFCGSSFLFFLFHKNASHGSFCKIPF